MSYQDVAVKVFSKQEYSKEVVQSFRQEVLFSFDCSYLTNKDSRHSLMVLVEPTFKSFKVINIGLAFL